MSQQYTLHIPVDEVSYNLYMSRYYEMKKQNPKASHKDLMRKLLGMQ